MKTDQLNGLIALKTVAERKNFTIAAQVLEVTPSAVSQAIKQLERRLGVALLSRNTRSTSLTEAGSRFLEQAGPAIDGILAAMDSVGGYAAEPSGNLRLNMSRSFFLQLGPLVTSFLKKHPKVSVEIFFDDDLSDIVAQGFDAGVRLSEMMAKDMVAVNLTGRLRFVTVASPKYLNKHGRPKHPKDLLNHNCIRLRIGENDFYDRWEFEAKGKDFQVQVGGSLVMNDSVLITRAAVMGNGITYCSEISVQEELRSGKLELVLGDYAAVSEGCYLYYPSKSQVLPKLRAFIDHCKAEQGKRASL